MQWSSLQSAIQHCSEVESIILFAMVVFQEPMPKLKIIGTFVLDREFTKIKCMLIWRMYHNHGFNVIVYFSMFALMMYWCNEINHGQYMFLQPYVCHWKSMPIKMCIQSSIINIISIVIGLFVLALFSGFNFLQPLCGRSREGVKGCLQA